MRITGRTRLAGIMGWPVAHSRSPALHNFWLDEQGIDGAYLPLPVHPEQLEQALRALPVLGFRGCNLTIPHKQMALSIVDRVEPLARRIGAMNTVIVAADGSLEGRNTDVYGFRENLRDSAPDWDPAAGPVVVLGAGGAARAVVAAAIEAGVREIRLVNRTLARADVARPREFERRTTGGVREPPLEFAEYSQVPRAQVGSTDGDSAMSLEHTIRIEQTVAVYQEVRPFISRLRHGAEHLELELLVEQCVEKFQSDADSSWIASGLTK